MHWSVADDPCIRLEQFFVGPDNFKEVRRACLFFALEEKFDIRCQCDSLSFQCFECSENCHYAGFVVRRRTAVDPPFWIDWISCRGLSDRLTTRFERG